MADSWEERFAAKRAGYQRKLKQSQPPHKRAESVFVDSARRAGVGLLLTAKDRALLKRLAAMYDPETLDRLIETAFADHARWFPQHRYAVDAFYATHGAIAADLDRRDEQAAARQALRERLDTTQTASTPLNLSERVAHERKEQKKRKARERTDQEKNRPPA